MRGARQNGSPAFSFPHRDFARGIAWFDIQPLAQSDLDRLISITPPPPLLSPLSSFPPKFSSQFPAERLNTKMVWEDLILPDLTMREVNDILIWLKHNDTLMQDWGMHRKLKRGFRTLFYGPPGTGKTLTASLLGKQMGLDVYRIDLSQMRFWRYLTQFSPSMTHWCTLADAGHTHSL